MTVTLKSNKYKHIVDNFARHFRTYKTVFTSKNGRITARKVFDKDYVVHNVLLRETLFPIVVSKNFAAALKESDIPLSEVDIVYNTDPKKYLVDISTKQGFVLRDYQVRYVETMTKNIKDNHTFLVDLQTGKGKSAIACYSIAKLKYRTCVLVKGQYIDKWEEDLLKYFDVTKDDILIVRGSDTLKNLMSMDKAPKFVIFSTRTMQAYINEYESLQIRKHFTYSLEPSELLASLNITTVLIDETHKEFHSIYKTVLSLDPTLLIGLSATLLHNDSSMNKLYELLYPMESRLTYLELDKYAVVKAISYRMGIDKHFVYTLGAHGYNQGEFELSIIKNHKLLRLFIDMIIHMFEEEHVKMEKEHHVRKKSMLFFGSVHMCTIITHVFKSLYKDRRVERYVSDDAYDDMILGDIIVTTPGSSGEAIDIPGLGTVLSAYATNSMQKNIQMLGRLREDPDITVKYIYFYCLDIPQHITYHHNRHQLYKYRVDRFLLGSFNFGGSIKYPVAIPNNLLKIKRKTR
jgi:hypothetical protein